MKIAPFRSLRDHPSSFQAEKAEQTPSPVYPYEIEEVIAIPEAAHEVETGQPAPQPTELTWHKVGNSALAHFGEVSVEQPHVLAPLEDFSHLFPATQIPAELLLTETWTAEDAELLAGKLSDGDPYKDYALSNLALHHLKSHDLTRAYDLMHKVENSALAVHVLAEVVFYSEDHPDEAIKQDDVLKSELRTKAINSYFYDPSAENALALSEASEALDGDKEIRQYAKQAIEQHPELQPDTADDNDLQLPKLSIMKRFYRKLIRQAH